MAAARQHTKKGRKKTNRLSFLCSFGGCFGISNKVSADHAEGKSVSARRKRAALPVNDHKIPPSSEIVTSSKEIHIVEDDEEKRSQFSDDFLSDKTRDKTSEKSKNRDENSPITSPINKQTSAVVDHDTWTTNHLSHSVSLPVLPHQKKEKPAAAVGGGFDSMLGAVIIMVTLVVMIIWGKIWAILCTAAWFYFIPRFRAKLDESYAIKFKNGESNRVDLDSWEYKKKVVLQGLLDRNQTL